MFKKIIKLPLISSIAFLATSCGVFGSFEEPNYDVTKNDGKIEHRLYKPFITAEVTVEGEKEEAVNKGFKILGGYIFGDNIAKDEIEMTVPVTQKSASAKSEDIEMTVPVTQKSLDDNKWKISFVMPSKYTLETLPKPLNDRVEFKKNEAQETIAIVFSGSSDVENFEEKEKELASYANSNNIEITSEANYAYYNPPWTPWFMKRNEVIFDVKK